MPKCIDCGIDAKEIKDTDGIDYYDSFVCVECQYKKEHDTFDENCKCIVNAKR